MTRHSERRRVRLGARGFAFVLLAVSLAGCSAPAPQGAPQPDSIPTSTATPTADAATPTPAPTEPSQPMLVPGGTAEENLPLFAAVVAAVWGTPQQVAGQAYIDALVAAGFDKAAMQLTPDESTVGNPAESIQFSVRWGDQCLVGQVGPATGAPVTVVLPALGEGSCLVGETRPIDW